MGSSGLSVRRYRAGDIPNMVQHLEAGLKLFHYRRCRYAPDKVSLLLRANVYNKQFFCNVLVDGEGNIGGGLAATIMTYMFSYEAYAQDHIFYIRDGFKSVRGATELIASYVDWAKWQGVRAVRLDQSSGYKIGKFAAFMKRQGFNQIGSTFQMEI